LKEDRDFVAVELGIRGGGKGRRKNFYIMNKKEDFTRHVVR
jgi:hypothetical protein